MIEDPRILVEAREESGTVFLGLDTGEVFELAPESVPSNLPEVGESISSPLLAEIKLAAERKQVARRIFSMLDRRLYPVSRLKDKLAEKGFTAEAVAQVLDQMAAAGLYSDRHYAEAWCRDCLRTKAVGRLYLEKRLREKRVDPAVARDVAREMLDPETEKELAVTAAEARWRREKGSDRRKSEAKIMRYLMGRGFPAQAAGTAVRGTAPRAREENE